MIIDQIEKSENVKKAIKEAKSIYQLNEDWDKEMTTFDSCFNLGDFVISDYHNNPEAKISPDSTTYKVLKKCYSLWINYTAKSKKVTKMGSSYPVESILSWMNSKAESIRNPGEDEFFLKYALISGHDITISPILLSLGLLDTDCLLNDLMTGKDTMGCNHSPPLASNILFELVQLKAEFYVRSMYNGAPLDICELNTTNNGHLCPLEEFTKIAKEKFVLDNY